jgi:carbonic anhydrase/acetyltransferase-like protein (isoleucine patch superfamily)
MIFSVNGCKPTIGAGCWIAPGASVMGRVTLSDASSVWFQAVLRGDNETISVGAATNIQDGCVLHTDPGFPLTIGDGCTIGHRAILHGCTIGSNTLIGMGSVIMNGAVIGENSIVGANSFIPEGKSFEPNSLIFGSPATVRRALSPEERQAIGSGAASYVNNAARFQASLEKVASESQDGA